MGELLSKMALKEENIIACKRGDFTTTSGVKY